MKQFYSRRDFIKAASGTGIGWAAGPRVSRQAEAETAPGPKKYEPTWDSLKQYEIPEWYQNAKFGIFLHWGVYAVPARASEWYPRLMYRRESEVFNYHREHFGPQSTFGYKDFIPKLKAENWDPRGWAGLFRKAGAKYVVPVGEHHDGFPMYDCSFTEWTAAKMGPRRDVVGELARAVRAEGLKLGVSSHRAFNWSYYTFEADFDTSDSSYSGLYGKAHAPTPLVSNKPRELVQQAPKEFIDDFYRRTVEIVDRYRPDLMWFDFAFESSEWEDCRKRFAAHYYNRAEEWGRGVVLNYKNGAYPEEAAVLDIERGLLDKIRPRTWQTDTSVSAKSWGYIQNDTFKPLAELVHELIDIVSKNGCLLLNVGPRPDGTIPEPAQEILLGMGKWLEVCGEAIYGARPWKIYGEGPTKLEAGSFAERRGSRAFTAQDIRFTTQPGRLYAICLDWPGERLEIKSLGAKSAAAPDKIADVSLLGLDGKLEWTQTDEALTVKTPNKKPCDYAYAFEIILKA